MASKQQLTAQQQELQEREKHLTELEQAILQLKSQQGQLNSQGQMFEKEKKRCFITKQELSLLTADHNVYRALGRAFVKQPVATLLAEESDREKHCAGESATVDGRKVTLAATLSSQQASFQSQYKEYVELAQQATGTKLN